MTQSCPRCGSLDAYIGMTQVECVNKKCSLYSKVLEEELTKRITVPAPPTSPVGSMHQTYDKEDFSDATYWAELMFNSD